MQARLNDLADKESADATGPTRPVDSQKTCTPASLAARVHVFFDHGTHTWFAVNTITREMQPLPAPQLAWTVALRDGKATLVDIAAEKFIDAFDYFSFQLWKQASNDSWVVRDSWHKEQPMLALSDFLTKHTKATLHVRSLTGISHQTDHKITVFMFDALCGGSSAYWSMTELLASLGIKDPSVYLRCSQKDYHRARLHYQLNDLDTTGRGDAAMAEHRPGCTQTIILFLARSSFRSKHHGGFGDDDTRSTCESLLRTLCTATHTGQTMRMPFFLKHEVKRHECGAIVGNDVVVISVQDNGIVDFSELRVRAQADTDKKKKRGTSQVWMKIIDMTFGLKDVTLFELLRWSVTTPCRPQERMKKRFSLQLLWNIGRALEKTLVLNVNAEETRENTNIVLECDSSPITHHRYVWPLRDCHHASRMVPHDYSPRYANSLVQNATLAFAQPDPLDHPLLQQRKAKAIRIISSLKQPTMYDATEKEAPFVMHTPEQKKTDKRPPTNAYQATSLPDEGSAQQITEQPPKKPTRSTS